MTIREHQIRQCLSCRGRSPKEELLRFVYFEGDLRLDEEQVVHTRGVYLHDRLECLSKPCEAGRWTRALRLTGAEAAQISRIEVNKVLEKVHARALSRI